MKKTLFIKNAVILTATGLLLRFIGIVFKVWLAALIGSEGIGLHQLVFSVYLLVSTFASSGITTAVTRLTAEEMATGSKKQTQKILKRSIQITLIIAVFSALAVFLGANLIADYLIEDSRAIYSLKILPFSLPFMGISACFRGYFVARRKVYPNAISQIAEQGIRILTILLLVKSFVKKGLDFSCAAVVFGDVISEIAGFIIILICYLKDRKKIPDFKIHKSNLPITKNLLQITLPITSGRYLNSLLRTAENILVPKNLNKYPLSNGLALSQFGMIKGMALPILFFPSTLLNSVSTLLVPEISEAVAKKQYLIIRNSAKRILNLTAVTSFIFSAIFLFSGDEIAKLFYKEENVGFLLKALSPIVPFMYLDSVSDGILKGLNQQTFTFYAMVCDSIIRIILVLIILPFLGINGFIGIMYFSNFLTCFLNVGRLIKVSGIKIDCLKEIFIPIFSAFSATYFVDLLLNFFNITENFILVLLFGSLSIMGYTALLYAFGIIKSLKR